MKEIDFLYRGGALEEIPDFWDDPELDYDEFMRGRGFERVNTLGEEYTLFYAEVWRNVGDEQRFILELYLDCDTYYTVHIHSLLDYLHFLREYAALIDLSFKEAKRADDADDRKRGASR